MNNESKYKFNQDDIERLEMGIKTELKDVMINDKPQKASLSLDNSLDGGVRLNIHTYSQTSKESIYLNKEENLQIMEDHKKEIIKPIQLSGVYKGSDIDFDKNEKNHLLEVDNNTFKIKNKELDSFVKDKKLNIGDQVNYRIDSFSNKEETTDIRINENKKLETVVLVGGYNKDSNNIEVINLRNLPDIKSINGKPLTDKEKMNLKSGNSLSVDGDTFVKYTAKNNDLIESNKNMVVINYEREKKEKILLVKSEQYKEDLNRLNFTDRKTEEINTIKHTREEINTTFDNSEDLNKINKELDMEEKKLYKEIDFHEKINVDESVNVKMKR